MDFAAFISYSGHMSTEEQTIGRRIAARLKARREGLGLSLQALADVSGVSRAMISKIERAEASPTAVLLCRLCDGLGTTLSGLMAEVERAPAVLLRAAEQPRWRDPASGYLRIAVSPTGTASRLDVVRVELPPGAEVDYGPSTLAGAVQHLVVLSGRLVLTLAGQPFVLDPGDCLYMQVAPPKRFANPGAVPCHYFVLLETAA